MEIIIAIILVGIAVAGIAIKILVKKNGQFAGTCSSNNPMLRDELGSCPVCGALPEDECKNEK